MGGCASWERSTTSGVEGVFLVRGVGGDVEGTGVVRKSSRKLNFACCVNSELGSCNKARMIVARYCPHSWVRSSLRRGENAMTSFTAS